MKKNKTVKQKTSMATKPLLVAGVGAAVKTLHLTLKKKWFDMILSGEKQEEYREIKPYWGKRLRPFFTDIESKKHIIFKNGYSKNAREMTIEFLNVNTGRGFEVWGAPNEDVFIIRLGKILETKNV